MPKPSVEAAARANRSSPTRFKYKMHAKHLVILAAALGFFASSDAALADGAGDPTAQPVAANPSPQILPATPAENDGKPTMLPKDEVNGLRERLAERDKMREEKGWGGFLCIKNGSLIDSAVFLAEYKVNHPNEQIRLVSWKHSESANAHLNKKLKLKMTGDGLHPQGFGDIVADEERPVVAFAVYTSGDELHIRSPYCDDRVCAFGQAKDIATVSDKELMEEYTEFCRMTGRSRAASSLDGDDENLQVHYAAIRLKAAGVPAFVIPATEEAGPDCNLILIFAIHKSAYAYRPNNGLFELSKDAFTKLESQQVADTNTQ